jgi:phosphopantothenoylcysteine decarboxylase/phosphopantothenate--cysteine ligase
MSEMMLNNKRILLIISGGIAAYKALEFIRRLKDHGCQVRCVLTEGGTQFVTPLSVAALSGERVYTDLFSLTDEAEMGHIRLSREADLVVVAPASADILAKMAAGMANDLATTALLATDKPVMVAPAMNIEMWAHPATRRNIATLLNDGIKVVEPAEGDLACGETGPGRMVEPDQLLRAVAAQLADGDVKSLAGRKALVTSGPTREALDPVRYISNFSSGKQGHAIAAALAALGAETTLVSGPTQEPDPTGVTTVRVESAMDMMAACEATLPVDIAVCAAAVSDWRASSQEDQKIKKTGDAPPSLRLTENPDVLASLARHPRHRPHLVIGFAAETENLIDNAAEKRLRKGCDWIIANDVSKSVGTFGASDNTIHLITDHGVAEWPRLSKVEVAERLGQTIAEFLAQQRPAA